MQLERQEPAVISAAVLPSCRRRLPLSRGPTGSPVAAPPPGRRLRKRSWDGSNHEVPPHLREWLQCIKCKPERPLCGGDDHGACLRPTGSLAALHARWGPGSRHHGGRVSSSRDGGGRQGVPQFRAVRQPPQDVSSHYIDQQRQEVEMGVSEAAPNPAPSQPPGAEGRGGGACPVPKGRGLEGSPVTL